MLKNKKTVIAVAVIGVLALVGIGGYMIAKQFRHEENRQNVKLENKLLIGTYRTSVSTDGIESYNAIHVQIVNGGEVVKKLDYDTSSRDLIADDNFPGLVFADLSDVMAEYIDNLGVYFWGKANPSKNYVKVQTEWKSAPYLSEFVTIADSGIFAVNVPSKNGEVPQVEHCYIYQQNSFGWW